MTSPSVDRRFGLNSSIAIKAPCRVAATSNLTLSGEQTIDGVSCVTDDRVLVSGQTNSVQNGIYVVDTGSWQRATDFDDSRDVSKGTIGVITEGSYQDQFWMIATSGTIRPGTTAISFAVGIPPTSILSLATGSSLVGFMQSGVGAVARTVQEKLRDIVNVRDFGAVGDGVTDDTAAIQAAITASGAQVDFGSFGTFLVTGPIGLPDQDLYSDKAMNLVGRGATILVQSAEAIFTSMAALAAPESTSNLFTGKINVSGLNFKGQGAASVVFNGDRLYNLYVTGCHFKACTKVVYSYRAKGAETNGYVQSVFFIGNHFSNCTKIVDAKRAFNFTFNSNFCEACIAGVYIDGTGDPAINVFRCRDNLFEGGGLFLKLGAVLGGAIQGNYLEGNSSGDVATLGCHIYMVRSTGGFTSGFVISGNTFQATSSQQSDTTWRDIKFTPNVQETSSVKQPVIIGNWTNSYQLHTENAVATAFGNGGVGGGNTAQRSGVPALHTSAGVSFLRSAPTYLASAHLSAGVFTIAEITTADIKSIIPANSARRSHTAELTIHIQNMTSGLVCVGASVAKILLIVQGPIGGGDVNTMFVGATLMGYAEIAAGQVFDTRFGSDFKKHFTAPALTVVANGADSYYLKLSGYAAPSVANYGAADRIISNVVLANNGSTFGGQLRGLLALV